MATASLFHSNLRFVCARVAGGRTAEYATLIWRGGDENEMIQDTTWSYMADI